MTGESINHTVTLEYPGCFDDSTIMHELLHALGILFVLFYDKFLWIVEFQAQEPESNIPVLPSLLINSWNNFSSYSYKRLEIFFLKYIVYSKVSIMNNLDRIVIVISKLISKILYPVRKKINN
jgi:hypothetical protein